MPNAVATNTLAAEYNKSIDAYTSSRKSPTKKPKRTAAVESSSLFVQNLVAQSFAVTAKDITQRHENHMEAADNDDETPQVITSTTTPTYVDGGTTLVNHKKRKTIKVEDTDDDDDDIDDDSSLVF